MHCCLLLALDLICIVVANTFVVAVTVGVEPRPGILTMVSLHMIVVTSLAIPVFLVTGLNRTLWRFTSLNDCVRIFLAVSFVVLAAAVCADVADYLRFIPPQLPALQILVMSAALVGVRALMRLRYARSNRRRYKMAAPSQREDVVLVGLNPIAELFLRCSDDMASTHVAVAGILSTRERHRGRFLGSCPVLGRPETIEGVLRDLEIHGVRIDRIVLAERFESLSESAQCALRAVERDFNIPLDCLYRRFGLDDRCRSTHTADEGALPKREWLAFSAEASPRNEQIHVGPTRTYLWWKRVLDVTISIVGLVFISPIILAVCFLVALDVGYPVIFWQQRPGASGQPIRVFKFRTMRAARDGRGNFLTDAERLSRVGRLLRRIRLDEIPQMYNVLIGQMSLIGPRPLLPVDQSPEFAGRLALKPGLTGWAQINGGRHLSPHDKAALDLWYARHASFGLDIRILMRTIGTVILGETIDRHAIETAWLELGGQNSRANADAFGDVPASNRGADWRWLKSAELRASAQGENASAP